MVKIKKAGLKRKALKSKKPHAPEVVSAIKGQYEILVDGKRYVFPVGTVTKRIVQDLVDGKTGTGLRMVIATNRKNSSRFKEELTARRRSQFEAAAKGVSGDNLMLEALRSISRR